MRVYVNTLGHSVRFLPCGTLDTSSALTRVDHCVTLDCSDTVTENKRKPRGQTTRGTLT